MPSLRIECYGITVLQPINVQNTDVTKVTVHLKIPVWQHTFVSPSAFSRRAVVSYWRKYVHEVLVNRLGGLSLPRKSVVRLTDRPDMTLDVYRGRKTTMQQQCNILNMLTSQIKCYNVTVFQPIHWLKVRKNILTTISYFVVL